MWSLLGYVLGHVLDYKSENSGLGGQFTSYSNSSHRARSIGTLLYPFPKIFWGASPPEAPRMTNIGG